MHERFQCFKTTPKRVNLSAKDIKNYFSVRFVAYFSSNINPFYTLWCLAAVESFQSQNFMKMSQEISMQFMTQNMLFDKRTGQVGITSFYGKK